VLLLLRRVFFILSNIGEENNRILKQKQTMEFAQISSGSREMFEDAAAPATEPDFTKKISSKTICDFFYYFFLAYVILGVLSLFALVGVAMTAKATPWGSIIGYLLTFLIASTTALFHYLVCSRALLK
jgi:hypothetical protein